MQEICTSESIRDRLGAFRSARLIQEKRYENEFCGLGGEWSSKDGQLQFTLERAKEYAFRSGELARDRHILLDGDITLGGNCWINICVTRRLEMLEALGSRQFLPGLPMSAGLVSHVTVERINFANEVRHEIDGLNEADLEKLADLIAPAMEALLQRSVAQEQREQAWRGRHAVPVAGKLHWRWRKPVPELVAFHALCADFAREATLARISSGPTDKYQREDDDGGYGTYRFTEDPSVTVAVPGTDRDSPYSRILHVKVDNISIPVEIHDLGSSNRIVHRQLALGDSNIFALKTYLAVHPQSLLLKPEKTVPPLDRKTADLAVYHARNVSLRICGKAKAVTPGRRGATEGQVGCSDVIVV